MKSLVSIIFVLFTAAGFAQHPVKAFKPISSFTVSPIHVPNTIFARQNVTKLPVPAQSITFKNIVPEDYNWRRDIRNYDAYIRSAYDFRVHDLCGRELPGDVFKEVTFQAVYDVYPK